MKGGISSRDLNKFIKSSYKPRNEVEHIRGYTLDKELSKKNARVYTNPEGKVIVSHTGTNPTFKDWSHNLLIPFGKAYHKTERFKTAKRVQKQAIAKYGKQNIETIGHSQAGHIVNELSKKGLTKKGKTVALNPAILNPFDKHKGVQVVRSKGDIVSALTHTGNKDVVIQNKTMNPLAEHGAPILSRVNQELGGMRYRKNPPMMMMYDGI